jgi:hypothetical protein
LLAYVTRQITRYFRGFRLAQGWTTRSFYIESNGKTKTHERIP